MREVCEAELTLIEGRFEPGVRVAIDATGRIESVGSGPAPTRRLPRRALLPGFVNAHSHAFQRGLRGLGESYPEGMGDFWSWREAMYDVVLRLTPAEFKRLCRQAFDEMLSSGITTVGEFHYLHHVDADAEDFAFDELVLEAARECGIRLVLLESYYKAGGFDRPLAGGQRRFATPDVAAFLRHVDALHGRLDPRTQSLGIAPHSLRAAPPDDLKALHAAAVERGMVCHVHVEEQRREIDECRSSLGVPPLEWILRNLPIGPHFTMIHATHSAPAQLERFVSAGANVCVCPLTEGNLGDGLGDVQTMLSRADAVCVGSDSNIRIDMPEELRWLEFVRRLRHEKRGVCKTSAGDVAQQLLACGTTNGARSLGLPNAGAIAAGWVADFLTIDLDHPSLAGATPDSLLAAFLLGSSGAAVREVCVAGRWVRGC